MGLLQLPGELIDEIITFTIPHGFESFALSCKTIYRRATAQLDRHNRLRRLWRYAYTPSNERGKPFYLLYELSRDPLLAQYIDVLNLRDPLAEGSQSDVSHLSDEFRMDDEAMDRIKTVATQSEWMEQAGVDVERWWETMMRDDDMMDEGEEGDGLPFVVVSLLSQLPNIKSLQLPDTWVKVRPSDDANELEKVLVYVLDAMVEYSNRTRGTSTPLKQLATLLPFVPAGYEARAGLQCVEPFLSLEGMRELFGVSLVAVDDQYTGIPFKWRSRLDSNLRRIELAYCCMDPEGLAGLVQHTPLLQVFRYSHETKWHGCQYEWNPGAFVGVLARYCGATITDLSLTIDELPGDVINGASSFLSFVKLASLEVDVRVFCGPPIESGQRKGTQALVPEGELPWTVHDIPCIGSMVPSSIVHMTINTDYPRTDEQALRSLLKNVRQQKAERLPRFQAVVVRQYEGDSGKDIFGIPGLVLCVDGNEVNMQPRAMLPTWKRDFATRVGGIAFQ